MNESWEYEYDETDHNEIAKLYAIEDMKEDRKKWAYEHALNFYSDFKHLDINISIKKVKRLIEIGEIKKDAIIEMLNHMILIFEEHEEYEKCNVCNLIKKSIQNVKY